MIDVKPNCEEYDPCAFMVDKICDDSKGSYECLCLPGYVLNKESSLCEGFFNFITINEGLICKLYKDFIFLIIYE